MLTKQIIKVLLDITMITLFIILLNVFETDLVFHEIAGLALLGLFIFHYILNRKWMKNITKNIGKTKINLKSKLMYATNIALIVGVMVIIISGVFISKILFPSIAIKNQEILILIHKSASYVCLGLIFLHVLANLKYFAAAFKKIYSNKNSLRYSIVAASFSIMIAGLIYWKASINNKEVNTANYLTSNSQITKKSDDYEYSNTDTTVITTTSVDTEPEVSLNEYLSNLFCNACHNHCSLANPRCAKADKQIENATSEYASLYS